MINFDKMRSLMRTARNKCDGKPLDGVFSLNKLYRRGDNMRNARLFNPAPDKWRVELHGNVIAYITELPKGEAMVTIKSVNDWPSRTTSNRLFSLLGRVVYSRDRKLRCIGISNLTGAANAKRNPPPLVDGQTFLINREGMWCTNPEVVTEQRQRVIPERSKPINAWITSARKIGTVTARIGGYTYEETKHRPDHPIYKLMELDASEAALELVTIGAWKYRRWSLSTATGPLHAGAAMNFLRSGIHHAREALYREFKVYETYTHSFKDQFYDCP